MFYSSLLSPSVMWVNHVIQQMTRGQFNSFCTMPMTIDPVRTAVYTVENMVALHNAHYVQSLGGLPGKPDARLTNDKVTGKNMAGSSSLPNIVEKSFPSKGGGKIFPFSFPAKFSHSAMPPIACTTIHRDYGPYMTIAIQMNCLAN